MLFRLIATALIALGLACSSASAQEQTYKVKKGNNLVWIAAQHNVSWEQMLLANEPLLSAKYDEVCGKLSQEFRNRADKREAVKGGNYYCNDTYRRPYGNTLRPGWVLTIPTDKAPASIDEVVRQVSGERIALVIDDTGSMADKRQHTANFYLAAMRNHGKKIVGVFLYADGKVRRYEAGGVRDIQSVMNTRGNRENTHGALREAAKDSPDAIILVTDEPGDDWVWSEVNKLPPVIAHCVGLCEAELQRLAKDTRGRYMGGYKTAQ